MQKPWRDLRNELTQIVLGVPWLVEILHCVRDLAPSGSYVAAGAIRNTVWDFLHGRVTAAHHTDVDVVYFAPEDRSQEQEQEHAERLKNALPQYEWEVANQALVHEWQSAELGRAIAPYGSLESALSVWPET